MKHYIHSKAEHADIPDIKRIEVSCGLSAWTIEAYEAEQKQRDSVMLKAHDKDGTIVGFIAGRAVTDGEAEILNIGVDPGHQRHGIGSMLLKEFCTICTKRGVSAVWLEVRLTNHSAIDFYRAHGFIKKGVRRNFYSNPTEDADVMALALAEPRRGKL